MALLLLAVVLFALVAYLVAELATQPARQQQLAVDRAVGYGRARRGAVAARRLAFRERVLLPAIASLARMAIRLSLKASVDATGSRLLAAGLSSRFTATQFLALKGALAIGGVLTGFVFGLSTAPAITLLVAPAFGAFGFILPDSFLTFKTRGRREQVRIALPDALDLLAVSVEAGLGFDGAVAKLTEHTEGPLADEFALTLSEIRIGASRHDALKQLAARVCAPEVSAFARSVIQADQLGISLGRILRVQAADSRLRRQAAAEERAMKAPIKMLFPTVIFIFPAMFLVILGPGPPQPQPHPQMTPEAETGFGTGLRAELERKQGTPLQTAIPAVEQAAASDSPFVLASPGTEPRTRGALADRVAAEPEPVAKEAALEALRVELERGRTELAAEKAELDAERARLADRVANVEARAKELESTDEERSRSAAEIATRLAAIDDREEALDVARDELERAREELARAKSELEAEQARVSELERNAETRAQQLESTDEERHTRQRS